MYPGRRPRSACELRQGKDDRARGVQVEGEEGEEGGREVGRRDRRPLRLRRTGCGQFSLNPKLDFKVRVSNPRIMACLDPTVPCRSAKPMYNRARPVFPY